MGQVQTLLEITFSPTVSAARTTGRLQAGLDKSKVLRLEGLLLLRRHNEVRVFSSIHHHRGANLAEVALALSAPGPFFGRGQGGQQQRCQDANNRNHNQQLDKIEGAFLGTALTTVIGKR